MSDPPYSSGTVMPCRPIAPISGQRWRGNSSVRSISAAMGATRAAAKSRTVSRSIETSSARSKSSDGGWLLSMRASMLPVQDMTGRKAVVNRAGHAALQRSLGRRRWRCRNRRLDPIQATNTDRPG